MRKLDGGGEAGIWSAAEKASFTLESGVQGDILRIQASGTTLVRRLWVFRSKSDWSVEAVFREVP